MREYGQEFHSTDSQDIISAAAEQQFHISALLPYQRLVISNILEGCGFFGEGIADEAYHRQIVILPTGSGKSLCFMLPGALLEGITLIIFPLLSLMADQARRLSEAELACGVLKGGMDAAEVERLLSACRSGSCRFILTNPEMLAQKPLLDKLSELPIVHAVVDEAHTVSEWGTTFRPSYLETGRCLQALGISQITAFTATAASRALEDITRYVFNDEPAHLIRGNPDRPNITYQAVPSVSKLHDLSELCRPEAGMERPIIVFCAERQTTERTAAELRLRLRDPQIRCYHAGLPKEERKAIEQWFFHASDGILISTTAYGMGVDKADIRSVIHFDLSSSIEAYLQETGRAGRDRKPAASVLLLGVEDTARSRTDGTGREDARRRKLLSVFTSESVCRRQALLAQLDAEPEVCFGCDICGGTRMELAEGEQAVTALIQRYQLTLREDEAAAVLEGRFSLPVRTGRLYRRRGFGALSGWEQDDIKEAVSALLQASVLSRSSRGPWKHRLRRTGRPRTLLEAGCLTESV